MPCTRKPELRFPVKLTLAQRRVVADLAPELGDRLELDEQSLRTIQFTLAELRAIHWLAGNEAAHAKAGLKQNALRHVIDRTAKAFDPRN
jgi:hypothetical protein